jgi:hypothetical protein
LRHRTPEKLKNIQRYQYLLEAAHALELRKDGITQQDVDAASAAEEAAAWAMARTAPTTVQGAAELHHGASARWRV